MLDIRNLSSTRGDYRNYKKNYLSPSNHRTRNIVYSKYSIGKTKFILLLCIKEKITLWPKQPYRSMAGQHNNVKGQRP